MAGEDTDVFKQEMQTALSRPDLGYVVSLSSQPTLYLSSTEK